MNLLKHDFLKTGRERRKKRAIFWIVGSALVLVIAAACSTAVPAIVAARSIYAEARAGEASFQSVQADIEDKMDLKAASGHLAEAQAHFESVQRNLGDLGWVGDLPKIRDEVAAAKSLANGGRDTAYALKEAIDVIVNLTSVLSTNVAPAATNAVSQENRTVAALSREDRRALLAQLTDAPNRLADSAQALDRALASFDAVPRTKLTAGILDALAPSKQKLIQLRGFVNQDLSFLAKIPLMVGYPEPKTYLFLLLNNTEMRPGGGFLGAYGVIKVSDGGIDSFFTDDVYGLDGPSEAWMKEVPPAPIARYLNKTWYMRDANWSPDFAVSAAEVERLYHLEKGPVDRFDGVIGITPTFIGKLLAITGPIDVDGHTFTADNVTDELEYQVEKGFAQGGVPYFQRKDIVGKLGDELVRRLLQTPVYKLPDVAAVAQSAVNEKHLMVSFADPDLMSYADARGWTGHVPDATGDSLQVVDANLTSLKTDAVMDRTISYALNPDGDGYLARAAITYHNTGHFDWKTTRYRTYARFYVPLGSTLVQGEGMMLDDKLNDPKHTPGVIDVSTDLGRTVFGGFISIEPGETKTLAVEYRLPDYLNKAIQAGYYHLDVAKQLGTLGHKLTLDLNFGKKLTFAAPSELQTELGDTHYRLETDLRVDRAFSVTLTK